MNLKKKREKKKIDVEKIKEAIAAKGSLRKAKAAASNERDDFLQIMWPLY